MSMEAQDLQQQEDNMRAADDQLSPDQHEEQEQLLPEADGSPVAETAAEADTEIEEPQTEADSEADAGAEDSADADEDEEVDEVLAEKEVLPADDPQQVKPRAKRKKKNVREAEPEKPVTILHLVFDEPGGEQIRQSFELDPVNTGEIIYIADNYSLGPVANLGQPEGWQSRKGWWQSVLGLDEEAQPEVMTTDKMKLHQLLQRLEEQEDTVLWIWMGQNERDVAGYYYVISHLMEFQGRIFVVYLNNLPFIDEKGHIFYPRQLSEILPKEYVKAARLARVVTLSEFELDPEEWEKLSGLPGSVRLLEGGKKLAVKDNDYYDKIILDQLGASTMKLSKLLGLLATKAKLGLPEYYIIWRVQSLIESGQIISQGEFEKGAKNVTLKATQGQMFVELNPEEGEESE